MGLATWVLRCCGSPFLVQEKDGGREKVVLDFLYGGGLVAGEDDWREKAAG